MGKKVLGVLKDIKTKDEVGRIICRNGDLLTIEYGWGRKRAVFVATLHVITTKFECTVEWK